MADALVEVRDVSKTYRLWRVPIHRISSAMLEGLGEWAALPAAMRRHCLAAAEARAPRFHALRNVSFSLRRGESLGIIGRNGSGKSTLLQILAGTLQPTSGEIAVRGRVAALLELGSGFNPEFTGRENVLIQTSLLGFSREQALEKFAAIAAFADIGEFIEQPVKVYSSGMMIRLAFATQTVLDPELFIVDEALSVGDVFFQARCSRFFRERLAAGMSLILVSHDLVSVKALCQRAIVLHQGGVAFAGPSEEAVNVYHDLHRGPVTTSLPPEPPAEAAETTVSLPPGAQERNWSSADEIGSREAEIVHVRLLGPKGTAQQTFELGEAITLECYAQARQPVDRMNFALEIVDRHHQVVYGVSCAHLQIPLGQMVPGRLYRYRVTFGAHLGSGSYLIDVALGWGDRGDGAPETLLHRVDAVTSFTVLHPRGRPRFFGGGDLRASIELS